MGFPYILKARIFELDAHHFPDEDEAKLLEEILSQIAQGQGEKRGGCLLTSTILYRDCAAVVVGCTASSLPLGDVMMRAART